MKYYTVKNISQNKALTAEGYLMLTGVPVSRVGTQQYHRMELGDTEIPGSSPVVTAVRNSDEVFSPESIASFIGKSITQDHPPEEVNPSNYKQYEIGQIVNAKPDPTAGVVRADILIKDPSTIKWLSNSNTECSVGYDAQYVPVGDNIVEQRDIRVNHIALVEEGRCGAMCATQDNSIQTTLKGTIMKNLQEINQVVQRFVDELKPTVEVTEPIVQTVTTADTQVFDAKTEIESLKAQVAELKAMITDKKPAKDDLDLVEWAKEEEEEPEHKATTDDEMENPEDEEDCKDETTDKKVEDEEEMGEEPDEDEEEEDDCSMKDSIEKFKSQLAIVAPGLDTKINDSKKAFKDSLCACQKAALLDAAKGKNKDAVNAVIRDRNLQDLDATVTSILFDAVAGAITAINNKKLVADSVNATGNSGQTTNSMGFQARWKSRQ